MLRLARPTPASEEGDDLDPALSNLEAWRGLAALAAKGDEGEGLASVEQELEAAGPVVLEAAAAVFLDAAAPERREPGGRRKKGKGKDEEEAVDSGSAIASAAASHAALLLEPLVLRTDGAPSASFLLRCLAPAAAGLAAAMQQAAAAPALPSETTGRLARVAGALAPAVEMGRGGAAAVVSMVRELLPKALGNTGLGHGDGEGEGLLDRLQLALCLLASACKEDAASAVALVDGGGVGLVTEAFALLLQEEGGDDKGQEGPVVVTEASEPHVIAAALEQAVQRQQAAWAAQATADGARRRRRRIAVGVASLAVLEGVQGKEGAGALVALSEETALSLLPSALALHARLGHSGTAILRVHLVSLLRPWMPSGGRWRAAVAAGGVPAATNSQAGEPDGVMVVHVLRDVVCQRLVLGRQGARPGECTCVRLVWYLYIVCIERE